MNNKRIHSHCDYMSPDDFERLYQQAKGFYFCEYTTAKYFTLFLRMRNHNSKKSVFISRGSKLHLILAILCRRRHKAALIADAKNVNIIRINI